MSSSTSKKKDEPKEDPYAVLQVEFGASDADITKAYRKLALQLHPDKLQAGLTDKKQEAAAKQFQRVQEARAFLLENKAARNKYDAKMASQRLRRQADLAREKGMSERRKRMREELQQQEAQAKGTSKNDSAKRRKQKQSKHEEELLEKLRKEGKEMREAYGDRQAQEAAHAEAAQQLSLEDRQVRLKWSRKKMKTSPSEHSLATMLSKFGKVEHVEMLGSKGNAASVTFAQAASVSPCVKEYRDSDEMRAFHVGKRKDRQEEAELAADGPVANTARARDTEDVKDWKLRQAAERERLLRELEEEEDGGRGHAVDSKPREPAKTKSSSVPFPPPFPTTDEYPATMSPLQKLETAENLLLKGIVSAETLQRMKIRQ